jgi:hypothetical protein
MPPTLFRQRFVGHIARRMSFYFVNHQKRDRVMVMDN